MLAYADQGEKLAQWLLRGECEEATITGAKVRARPAMRDITCGLEQQEQQRGQQTQAKATLCDDGKTKVENVTIGWCCGRESIIIFESSCQRRELQRGPGSTR